MPTRLYSFPRQETTKLKEEGAVNILFPMAPAHVEGYAEPMRTTANTEAQYPAIADKKSLHDDRLLTTYADKAHGTHKALNAACLWNYLGDATHRSELIPTPHHWCPGFSIRIDGGYGQPAFLAKVEDIQLLRFQDVSWCWLVRLVAEA
jgi:hypothetical protein